MGSILPFKMKGNKSALCTPGEINIRMGFLDAELREIEGAIDNLKKRRRKVLIEYHKLVPERARLIIAAGMIVMTLASVIAPVSAMDNGAHHPTAL